MDDDRESLLWKTKTRPFQYLIETSASQQKTPSKVCQDFLGVFISRAMVLGFLYVKIGAVGHAISKSCASPSRGADEGEIISILIRTMSLTQKV